MPETDISLPCLEQSMLSSLIRDFGNFFFLRIMGRWVAGAEADDAIRYCKKLNGKRSSCVINFLGEHYHKAAEAEQCVQEYKQLLDKISRSAIRAGITIKPSQFGFNVNDAPKDFCEKNMLEVARYAAALGIVIWLDMESSQYTDFTIEFFKKYAKAYPMGICLQACLRRTAKDLVDLIAFSQGASVRIRLVKGVYLESDTIAYTEPAEIHKNFLALIRMAFTKSSEGFGIAVGTHHTEAVALALSLNKKYPKKFFELEVLMGVLPQYYEELRKKGINPTEYVPYGKDAFAYSVRRAMKNPRFASSMLFAPFFDAYKKLYK